MARSFHSVDLNAFREIASAFPFTRRITEVHLHHTWRPRQSDYRGLATIQSMWRHHTQNNGWSDIAQHVTIAPRGEIWLCRNFNAAPASSSGFNGNASAGPFMIEMIGDFDVGQETITKEQKQATLGVISAIQMRFNLAPQDMKFHSEMSGKTCPGTSFDKAEWIGEVAAMTAAGGNPRSSKALFADQFRRGASLIQDLLALPQAVDDMATAEHVVGYEMFEAEEPGGRGGSLSGAEPSPQMIEALSDHVVNLERGSFSDSGRIGTTKAHVDRLFEERIPKEIAAAKARKEPARLLFYAHGGLVSEKNALHGAFKQLRFWRENKVYPVFFIWETGLAETIRQLMTGTVDRIRGGARGPFDFLLNAPIEELVRGAGGRIVWDGMKSSAERASGDGGGAAYVAAKAAALAKKHGDDLEIHVVGHSAGSIFHAYFLSALANSGASVKTAHFLAPAIRNDLFHQRVAPLLGKNVGPLTIFTMRKQREKDDTVTPVYRQSLLYLIYEALEERRKTDILGLEISLRGDKLASDIFGLRGMPSELGEVVWAPSNGSDFGSASDSCTHGGFDDDAATMNSVVRRVLDRRNGEPIFPLEDGGARVASNDLWDGQLDVSAQVEEALARLSFTPIGSSPAGTSVQPATPVATRPVVGARRALCIGINDYRYISPLRGCLADAKLWAQTLEALGYTAQILPQEAATAAGIRARVTSFVAAARAGDDLVLQFAGHGSQLEDLSGDEAEEGAAVGEIKDECLCAIDCGSDDDGLVIDDELRIIFSGLADGASLTCFFDCCHSGTISRVHARALSATRLGARGGTAESDLRARYVDPTPAMKHAYARRSAQLRRSGSRAPFIQRDVSFSACTSQELAYESNGQGEFTLQATSIISEGIGVTSNSAFLDRILQRFGEVRRQSPVLDCAPEKRSAYFLSL